MARVSEGGGGVRACDLRMLCQARSGAHGVGRPDSSDGDQTSNFKGSPSNVRKWSTRGRGSGCRVRIV